MLTTEQKLGVREGAVGFYQKHVALLKEAGFILSETDGGRVRAEMTIGGATLQPFAPFPKRNLASKTWTPGLLRSVDAYVTKAQIEAEIEDAVRDLPL